MTPASGCGAGCGTTGSGWTATTVEGVSDFMQEAPMQENIAGVALKA